MRAGVVSFLMLTLGAAHLAGGAWVRSWGGASRVDSRMVYGPAVRLAAGSSTEGGSDFARAITATGWRAFHLVLAVGNGG